MPLYMKLSVYGKKPKILTNKPNPKFKIQFSNDCTII